MNWDINKYKELRQPLIKFINKYSHVYPPKKIISYFSVYFHVHLIITSLLYMDIMGESEEIKEHIKNIKEFYAIKD